MGRRKKARRKAWDQFADGSRSLLIGAVVATGKPYSHNAGVNAAECFAAIRMITKLLKETVDERRPDGDNNNSFPSEHAALCVAAAIFIEREHGGRIGTAAWALAAAVGLARIESKRHYPSDVLAGAAIGWLAAHITIGLSQAAGEAIGSGTAVQSRANH